MSEVPKTDQNHGMDISTILNNPQVQKLYVNRTVWETRSVTCSSLLNLPGPSLH